MSGIKVLARSFSAVALLGLVSCNYQVKKTVGGNDSSPASKPEALISFADVNTRVFTPYCTKCHDEFGTYKELMGSGDVSAGHAAASPLFAHLKNNGGDMPRNGSPLPEAEVALLRTWIDSGAPEFAAGDPRAQTPVQGTPAPEPTPPARVEATFTSLEAVVFSQKCVMCHSDAKRVAGFSLETYTGIVTNARLIDTTKPSESGLLQSIVDDYMPPARAVMAGQVATLTDDEKAALKAWIEAGASNN